jgi:hypothetical protein
MSRNWLIYSKIYNNKYSLNKKGLASKAFCHSGTSQNGMSSSKLSNEEPPLVAGVCSFAAGVDGLDGI